MQPGQGTHAFIGDINGNGVNDLNEFEVAAFQDQADFIKIFTPTSDFVRTFSNQFNQGWFLKPDAAWGSKEGVRKILAKFSNRTNYRVNRKVTDKSDYYNPFIGVIEDTSLVTLNFGILNTIYFNRANTKYSVDFTYQDNRDKSLLINGIESRRNLNKVLKGRWNVNRYTTLNIMLLDGEKSNLSEFFENRNFSLQLYELEPMISIQPNARFKTSVHFNFKEKKNASQYGGENSLSKEVGGELRYNAVGKGSLNLSYSYINIDFSSIDNASLAYEMLEGLQAGDNVLWQFTFQRNISKNMQLNLNYFGRKSNNDPFVHTGGVQVRAFF